MFSEIDGRQSTRGERSDWISPILGYRHAYRALTQEDVGARLTEPHRFTGS